MVIIDTALEERDKNGKPIQIGIISAGYMGRGMVLQIQSAMKGMRIACLYNRTLSKAQLAFKQADIRHYVKVETIDQLDDTIRKGVHAITDNPYIVCESPGIDIIIEASGQLEFGARVVMRAIEHKKHVILMNAELDATVGPILKLYADRAGVIITNADGDQPGVIMNTYRFVDQIGYHPVLAGNIKGLLDQYRTPETQKAYAEKHKQKPRMITSFADGTKLAMEMAVVANATGFKVGRRGMYGPKCVHVSEAINKFSLQELLNGGLVDYVLGAEPGPGVFILGYNEHPLKKEYMKYFKMGDGPLYVFYVPYHLPHLEVPITVARAVIFRDHTIAPKGKPVCEVAAVAKTELDIGDTLDGIGGYKCYGLIENRDTMVKDNLLPMGLTSGCVLTRRIPINQPLTFEDVELPNRRLINKLYKKQNSIFDNQFNSDRYNSLLLDVEQLHPLNDLFKD
jgi:predicted homoserine dehydrogenase-like protein